MNDEPGIGVLKDGQTNAESSLKSAPRGLEGSISAAKGAASASTRVRFEQFVLDLQRGCLLTGNEEIPLRPKTFEVLRYLAGNSGRLVPKDELIKAVWASVIVTDDSLFQCIAELRRVLHDNGRLIKTVQRRGYRFDAEVMPESNAFVPRAADGARPRPPVAEPLPRDYPGVRVRRAHPVAILSAIAIVLILALPFAINISWFDGNDKSASAPPLSLVVLPFSNLSDDPDQEYFAAGVTADLTTDLSRLPGFFVISPPTAQTLKAKPIDPKQIGRDLNVRYLVEGSVARSGKEVRINVRLIDAATGSHLWVDRLIRERDQLPAWQDELVGGIAGALNIKLTRLESERTLRERPHNPEAYDLTTRGWAHIYTAKKPENYDTARALFKEALARDPQAVNALAGMGWAGMLSVLNGWSVSPEHDLALARSAVDQLLAIDPNHVIAHHVRGLWLRLQQRTEAARDAFQTVVSLNPNFAPGHAQLGVAQLELGRPEECIRSVERALRLGPRDPNVGHWSAFIGMAELHLGHYPEAVTWLTRAHNIVAPSATVPQHAYLVSALALAGCATDAKTALAEFQKAKPGVTITSVKTTARSNDADFLAQRQRLYEGLRNAGLPD